MPVKLEIAQILASASLVILVAALVAWARKDGRVRLPRGGAAALSLNSEPAAMLLLAAVGVSGVAAILAAGVWF